MLKTDCPFCRASIFSPLLSELQEMECPTCGKSFKVKDICITAGPYSIFKDVLLKHRHKYIRLLREAQKEAEEVSTKKGKPYKETQKTMDEFVSYLHELLDGGRDSLRVSGEGVEVSFTAGGDSHDGKLINISTTGACIEIKEDAPIRKGSSIPLSVREKGVKPLSLKGVIVWRSREYAGVRFVDVDEGMKRLIREIVFKRSKK